jgi:hypothetical protein
MDAQELRNLQEAYLEVVENQQLDEEQSPIPRGTPMNKRWPYISNKDPEFQTALDRVNKKKSKKKDVSAESYDIYDIILSHLLDEGYAETPEAAEAIMVNMSEEWREDIMEGYKRYPSKKVGNKLDRMYNDPDTDTRFGKTGKRYGKMMDVDSHMKGEVHPLIRAHSPKKSKAKEAENKARGQQG